MTYHKPKKLSQLIQAAVGAGTMATMLASPVFAQQAAPQKIEKIEVTGSNIKRIDAESSAPIQIITADEIRRSGKQTVTELLRELPSNAAGGLTELTGSGSFSTGAASASLRGLGSSATLVLLNGRRIAPYGLADPNFGQSAIVNLNSIPLDVVERVEILKDGASASYGSEAIAGVINIILRKDYKGGQLGVQGTANKDGDYRTQTVTGTFGKGDLAKDKYNVFGNVEVYHQDHVLFNDVQKFLNRNEYRNNNLTGIPTSAYSPYLTYLNRNAGGQFISATAGATCPPAQVVNSAPLLGLPGTQCLYDNTARTEIVPKVDRASFFGRGTYELSATTQLFAEAGYVQSKTYYLGYPQAVGQGTGGTFNPSTGALNAAPVLLWSGHPNNTIGTGTQSFRGRLDAVGPQDNDVVSKTTRLLGGIKTVFRDFDIESGLLYNRNEQDSTNYNSIRYSQLVAGINGNGTAGSGYNFLNPTAGTVTPDMLRINAKDKATSSFTIFDVKASGEFGALPGGAIGVASGLEFRKEDRVVNPDPAKLIGEVFGRGIASADGSRNVSTIFAELSLPVIKSVEVQLAGRYDRYSDYGSSFTPKIAASWAANSSLKFRGSFARGFRAPSLTENSKSSTSGFFNGFNDPRRCRPPGFPAVVAGCNISAPALIVANPDVKPEKSESWSGGFIFEPTVESSISIDYFAIARKNEITFTSLNDLLINEGSSDPRYANKIVRDPTNTSATLPGDPGAILYIKTGFDNLGETRVKGMDIDARYRMSIGELGKLTFNLNATNYFEQKGSGAPNAILTSFNGYRNAPVWRAQFRTNWEIGNWTNTAALNYLDGFNAYPNPQTQSAAAKLAISTCGDANNTTYLGVCRVKDYATVDVSTEYRGFKNLRISFAIRNLENTKPSKDPRAQPYNITWYQPQGMNFVLGARYIFN